MGISLRRAALPVVALFWMAFLPFSIAQEPKTEAPEAKKSEAPAVPKADPAGTPDAKTAKPDESIGRGSLLRLFTQANPMLWPLGLCSIVTLGFSLERLVALRRERVIPRDFVSRFLDRLSGGKLDRDRALELCRANESVVARVFAMVVSNWGQSPTAIRMALASEASSEVLELKRNIRVLNGTATLAPLLGLLGTVVGMIQAFDALGGKVGAARGEALAQGISLALVATAIGLGIAVVSVAAYYFLLNRVDLLVRELDEQARKVIELVAVEPVRTAHGPERRGGFGGSGDLSRHESRVL